MPDWLVWLLDAYLLGMAGLSALNLVGSFINSRYFPFPMGYGPGDWKIDWGCLLWMPMLAIGAVVQVATGIAGIEAGPLARWVF